MSNAQHTPYLTRDQVLLLNDKHGYFEYSDAQGDVSRAFAQDAIEMHERIRAAAQDLLEALLAQQEADDSRQAHDDLVERAYGEGWDNDPTGSSHITSAATRSRQAIGRADILRRAAIAKATGAQS